jgi:hypothetical protein
MNVFFEKFKDRINDFWGTASDDQKKHLLQDVLQYANANPPQFKKELKEVQFDAELTPLPIVLEALSKETDTWDDLYLEILDDIFTDETQTQSARQVLNNLMEFYFIETDTRPFVQKIANRIYKEIDSNNIPVKIAAICTLPNYLNNPSVKDRTLMIDALQGKLDDPDWRIRYVSFKYLSLENLLPNGRQLSVKDKLLKLMRGEPEM